MKISTIITNKTAIVIFEFTENRNVIYIELEPLHSHGQIHVFKMKILRIFIVSVLKLISRIFLTMKLRLFMKHQSKEIVILKKVFQLRFVSQQIHVLIMFAEC